jgi:hypothetical protein
MSEEAVQLTPDSHRDKPSLLNNLGNSLLGRFKRLGNLSDINKSILMFEDTIRLTPDSHLDRHVLGCIDFTSVSQIKAMNLLSQMLYILEILIEQWIPPEIFKEATTKAT